MKNSNPYDWIIHFVSNGACDCCGNEEDGFPECICNAHTHGMEKYGHLDFQIVVELPYEITGHLLNNMGERVRAGEKFKDGDVISDLLRDYDVRLLRIQEMDREVLRILLPDKNHLFPGDAGCEYPYSEQTKIF